MYIIFKLKIRTPNEYLPKNLQIKEFNRFTSFRAIDFYLTQI